MKGRQPATETLTSRQFRLSRPRTLALLGALEETGDAGVSVFLPPGLSPAHINDLFSKTLPGAAIPVDAAEIAAGSRTGAAIVWGTSRRLLIQPPFPLKEQLITPGCDVGPLRALLEQRFTIALVLVRLGAFAVGVWHGEELVASKTGTGLVHGRHRKGGQSQRRFERRREKQADVFLDRVCGHVQGLLGPYVPGLDYLVHGGARTTIRSLQQVCPFLRQFQEHTLPPLLDIPRPRRAVLETAIDDVLSSRITEWGEGQAVEIDTSSVGA